MDKRLFCIYKGLLDDKQLDNMYNLIDYYNDKSWIEDDGLYFVGEIDDEDADRFIDSIIDIGISLENIAYL